MGHLMKLHGVLKARILKWFAIPFSSGPHCVRPHCERTMWSTGEGNGKPLQYSCLENPMQFHQVSHKSFLMKRSNSESSAIIWLSCFSVSFHLVHFSFSLTFMTLTLLKTSTSHCVKWPKVFLILSGVG